MRRSPYPLGHPHKAQRAVVDRQVAERLLAERDALAAQLERARETFAALRRRLELREEESAQLRHALETRAGGGDSSELRAELARLEQSHQRLAQERDRAVRAAEAADSRLSTLELARDEAIAERDNARATATSLQVRLDQLQASTPDSSRAQRLAADLANLRRRRDEDLRTEVNRTRARLLAHLGDVRDSLERALIHHDASENAWSDGVRGVLAQLDGHLRREGVELTGTVGELFDPTRHEAIGTAPHPEGRANTIVQVLSPGLLLEDDDLLVRPAKVIVSV